MQMKPQKKLLLHILPLMHIFSFKICQDPTWTTSIHVQSCFYKIRSPGFPRKSDQVRVYPI